MNLALFFEGTGQGVRGRSTNVSLVHDACIEDAGQRRHLEAGPGARVGAILLGRTSGVGWRTIFSRARRWYEGYVPLTGEQVEEELFPGVHSDVGGLYEDNHELADAARAWVAAPAAARGLRFREGTDFSATSAPTTAVRHDSLRLVSNLFGLLRPARRLFPKSLRRHGDEKTTDGLWQKRDGDDASEYFSGAGRARRSS